MTARIRLIRHEALPLDRQGQRCKLALHLDDLGRGGRAMRYAIQCTPGGLLRDDQTDNVIYFNSHAEAETEVRRLTQQAALPGG
jgi:hypothetical protein